MSYLIIGALVAGLPLTGSAVEAATPVACGDVLSEQAGSATLPTENMT